MSVFLPESIAAPGSGTRHKARVRPGVSKERGFLLPMWNDVVRSLFVDATAYEPVLDALSVNATVCESMKLVTTSGSALLLKFGGDVGYLVSAVGSSFSTPHIDAARIRHWFGEGKGFPRYRVCYVTPGSDLQAEIAYGNRSTSESQTGAIRKQACLGV